MKLNIEQNPEMREVEITIRCNIIDERLAALVRQIQLYAFSVPAEKDGRTYALAPEDIFYFESVDEKSFVCCHHEVYSCALRLYELEDKFNKTSFVRVSKSLILNSAKVQSVAPLLGGRLEALLENGEKALISRHYVPAFKAQFTRWEEKP